MPQPCGTVFPSFCTPPVTLLVLTMALYLLCWRTFHGFILAERHGTLCPAPPSGQANPSCQQGTERELQHRAQFTLQLKACFFSAKSGHLLCARHCTALEIHTGTHTHMHTHTDLVLVLRDLRVCIDPFIFSKCKICLFVPSCFKLGLF